MKQPILVSSFILIGAAVVAGIILYDNNRLPWSRGELSNCMRLQDGNVKVEVKYPDEFVSESDSGGIRLYRKGDIEKYKDDKVDILAISSNYHRSLETIISPSFG